MTLEDDSEWNPHGGDPFGKRESKICQPFGFDTREFAVFFRIRDFFPKVNRSAEM